MIFSHVMTGMSARGSTSCGHSFADLHSFFFFGVCVCVCEYACEGACMCVRVEGWGVGAMENDVVPLLINQLILN